MGSDEATGPAGVPLGHKIDSDRAPLDLVDGELIEGIAWALLGGATKYEPWNHLGGFGTTRILASMLRHLYAWQGGEENDPEVSEIVGRPVSHLWCAGAQLMFLVRQTNHPERYGHLDDRPRFSEVPVKEADDRWKK